jgi:dihydroorotase
MGMLGLETALSVVQSTMVDTGLLDWSGVADRMSVRPARIGGLAEHGRLFETGAPANVVLVDPAASRTIEPEASQSRSRNTPFAGMKLPGAIIATLLHGVATVLDGRVVER